MSGASTAQVSVGNLVAFAARTGDLGTSSGPGPTAQQGVAGHTWLAKQKPKHWCAEVTVKHCFNSDYGNVLVSGRVDFVCLVAGANPLVEEIKTCLGDPQRDFGASEHWAQAKVYGFLLAQQSEFLQQHCEAQQLTDDHCLAADCAIDIRLTRLDLLSRNTYSETQTYRVAELQQHCVAWVNQYSRWLMLLQQQRTAMRRSAQQLLFPYPQYRPQQQAVARHVYRCIRDQRHLLLQAPTGSGKTMSACFPTVKALGEGVASRVLYLTSKGSSQRVALESLQQLREAGLQLAVLQLTAKSKVCPCQQNADSTQALDGLCERRVGYYDRLPAARLQALSTAWLDEQTVQDIARQHQLCPFEFSLEMAPWMDWVVADVNYWFDPIIRMANLEQGEKPLLLLDEVHNLPDRVRSMFSAVLASADLVTVKTHVLPSIASALADRSLRKCQRLLAQLSSKPMAPERIIDSEQLTPLFEQIEKLLAVIDEARANPATGTSESLFAADVGVFLQPLRRFLGLQSWLGEHHLVVVVARGQADVQCQLVCLNAGPFIAARQSSVQNQIGFSATLHPAGFYLDNLGLSQVDDEQLHWLQLPSYFPPHNLGVYLVNFINTRWQARNESLPRLIDTINTITKSHAGNYLLVLPSFDYIDLLLSQVPDAVREQWLVQTRQADEADRKSFIQVLLSAQEPTVAVVVLGGFFTEALDIPDKALQGVIVVGTGMGQPNVHNKALQNYWHSLGRDGFDYSFRLPGFAKVVQAAGRVVRSESDRGVVVLVDDRFVQPMYKNLYPPHWQPCVANSAEELAQQLNNFWRE